MVKIAPSILSSDFSRLGEEIKNLEKYGADIVHIDVMDGMFVPNITFGAPVIKCIRSITKMPFDVHLMIESPARYIEDFVKAGADIITVHYEAEKHLDRTLNYIKSFGVKAAVALNPATSIDVLENVLPIIDMVLIMTVNPGFGGQKYIQYCGDKVSKLNKIRQQNNYNFNIEVDGGIDKDNIDHITKCGADIVVAGSSVFKNGEIEQNIKTLKEAILL